MAKFATMIDGVKNRKITVISTDQAELNKDPSDDAPIEIDLILPIDENDVWRKDIIDYLTGVKIDDENKRKKIEHRAIHFQLVDGELYKKSIQGPLMKCLGTDQATYVMREIHEGSCGNHSGGRALCQKILR